MSSAAAHLRHTLRCLSARGQRSGAMISYGLMMVPADWLSSRTGLGEGTRASVKRGRTGISGCRWQSTVECDAVPSRFVAASAWVDSCWVEMSEFRHACFGRGVSAWCEADKPHGSPQHGGAFQWLLSAHYFVVSGPRCFNLFHFRRSYSCLPGSLWKKNSKQQPKNLTSAVPSS